MTTPRSTMTNFPGALQREILAILISRPGEFVPPQEIANLLSPPRRARVVEIAVRNMRASQNIMIEGDSRRGYRSPAGMTIEQVRK